MSFLQNEKEQSRYNFAEANVDLLRRLFADFESESKSLAHKALPIPAYEMTMKCSHIFNLLDARGVVSATERVGYVSRVRALAGGGGGRSGWTRGSGRGFRC